MWRPVLCSLLTNHSSLRQQYNIFLDCFFINFRFFVQFYCCCKFLSGIFFRCLILSKKQKSCYHWKLNIILQKLFCQYNENRILLNFCMRISTPTFIPWEITWSKNLAIIIPVQKMLKSYLQKMWTEVLKSKHTGCNIFSFSSKTTSFV